MGKQAKNALIGFFVAVAIIIVIFVLLFLHPSVGDEGQILYVRFADIDKVTVGSRVTFAGKPVGEVTEIKEIKDGRSGLAVVDGEVYVYVLTLAVDSGVKVYTNDSFSLRTSGLLGERSVAIIPRPVKPGEALLPLTRNDIIYAEHTGSVEEAMNDFKQVANKLGLALDAATEAVEEMNRQRIWQHLGATAQNLQEITDALNKPQELSSFVLNVSKLSEKALLSWEKVDATLANTEAITSKIERGEGTIGKIVMTDDLYLRLGSILSKGETIANDVTHYGLLFHNNKQWQRLRARRLNLLQKLSSPQEFRNYFNDEMDEISTSLSRVSMVLDKTLGYCGDYPLSDDREFTKVFAELMRRVEALDESLKMYNQQVMDLEVKKTESCQSCCQEG